MSRSHTTVLQLRVWSKISSVEVPPEKQRIPAPHQDPYLKAPCQEEKSPQSGFHRKVLKGLHTDSLAFMLTYLEFQCWGSSSKSIRDVRGEAELISSREKAGRQA